MHEEWLLRHRQRHLLCSMLHPKATCVFVDTARGSHVGMDPPWDSLKLHLNDFLLPHTFDRVSSWKIIWFFQVPINLTAPVCVFYLLIYFDLYRCYFFTSRFSQALLFCWLSCCCTAFTFHFSHTHLWTGPELRWRGFLADAAFAGSSELLRSQ